MAELFSNRQSLLDAATVLAARRAIDREIAHLVADPFDRDAAERLRDVVGANADRAQEALERLVRVSRVHDSWASDVASTISAGTGSADEVAPRPSPYRLDPSDEEPTP